MVFDKESDLSRISHTVPVGTMAYVKDADTFYLKTSDKTNTWRVISMVSCSFSWTTCSTTVYAARTHLDTDSIVMRTPLTLAWDMMSYSLVKLMWTRLGDS